MKKYIDFLTEKRKNTKNESEKSLFNLMNNSAYGKTMENLRKRMNVRLVNNAKDYLKYVSKPAFISQKVFSEDFAVIHKIKSVLVLNKSIYVGFTWCMTFITTLSRKYLMLTYCLLIQTVLLMKWNRKMFIKNFLNINTCLI